jgi:hypothetical protein
VTALFDNDHIPDDFETGSWKSAGATITVDYIKVD